MRYKLNEITPKRIYEAVQRRIVDIPDRVAWNRTERGERNREKLSSFKNRHAGERCFLIANGPSLNRMDLTPLKDEITIGLNRIYLLFDKMGFEPTYFVSIADLVLEQYHGEIAALSMPKFIGWKKRGLFPEREDISFLRTILSVDDHFMEDVTQGVYGGATVTYHALQLLYFMGFEEVVLVGLDHNFAEKGTPNKTITNESGEDVNHFHPDYFGKGVKWQLPDLYRTELAYAKARQYYEAHGRRILDATVGGHCTIFEKAEYEQVLRGRAKTK